jgi:hypothetical protein
MTEFYRFAASQSNVAETAKVSRDLDDAFADRSCGRAKTASKT